MKSHIYRIIILSLMTTVGLYGQSQEIKITLQETINKATDSSVQMLKARYLLSKGRKQYHHFKVYHLPKITFQTTPISYNRILVERYDSEQNIDVYRAQQSLNSSGNLSIQQNVGLTGGQFFVNTELRYLKNFGVNTYTQFTSVPFRVGYSQKLFGFNSYKWDKKIEPIKYKRIEKEHLCRIEEISKVATMYFFDLAYAQTAHQLATQNLENIEALYKIALKKEDIGAISENDLLSLKLEKLNYKRNYDNTKLNLKQKQKEFCNFLRVNPDSIRVILPQPPIHSKISEEQAIEMALVNNPLKEELKENLLLAQREVDIAKKSNHFSANVSASIGFNQVDTSFQGVYKNPKRQDMAQLSIRIPLVDWGVNKNKIVIASENLNITKATNQQKMQSFINEIKICVNQLNIYQEHLKNANETIKISNQSYQTVRKMFIVGKANVNDLNISISKQIQAKNTYVKILKEYWVTYYKLRRLTLFDF